MCPNLTCSVCAYNYSCFLLRLGLFTALKVKIQKTKKSAARSWSATDTFPHCAQTEPESTRTQQQHVVFERSRAGQSRAQKGREAGLHYWIFTVCFRAQALGAWMAERKTKQKKKADDLLYADEAEVNTDCSHHTPPTPPLPLYITPLCSFVCSVCRCTHWLCCRCSASFLDGLSSHQ